MNYPYLQAQEVVVLDQDYSDIKLSGTLNGKTTANKSLPNALKTDISITHQYLAMSEHSSVKGTPEDIEEWLILSAAASLANPSQSQVSEMLKMTSEICGQQRVMSFEKLNRSFVFSKTSQAFCRLEKSMWVTDQGDLFHTSTPYCESLPKSGMVLSSGQSSGQMMSEGITEENGSGFTQSEMYEMTLEVQCTEENDYGLLPTPTTNETEHPDMVLCDKGRRKAKSGGGTHSLNLADTVRWATPNTLDGLPPKSPEALQHEMEVARPGRSKPANLRDQVSNGQNWPTPTTRDVTKRGKGAQERKGNPVDTLPLAVERWPSPSANEDAAGTPKGNMQPMLGNHPGIRGETEEEWKKGSLNADWVEALMGWPIGWTDLEPMEPQSWWDYDWDNWEPDIPRVTKGQNGRAKRLKAIGNGQVPLTNAVAWKVLYE